MKKVFSFALIFTCIFIFINIPSVNKAVAVGEDTGKKAVQWSKVPYSVNSKFDSIAYGNGKYVGFINKEVSNGYEYHGGGYHEDIRWECSLCVSTDCRNWNLSHWDYNCGPVVWLFNRFIVLDDGKIIYSKDGENWEEKSFDVEFGVSSAAEFKGRLYLSCGNKIITTSDFEKWEYISINPDIYLEQIVATDDALIAIGNQTKYKKNVSEPKMFCSIDGKTWDATFDFPLYYHREISTNGKICIVNGGGEYLESDNGREWVPITFGDNNQHLGIDYLNGEFITTDKKDRLYESVNGKEWKDSGFEFCYGINLNNVIWNGKDMIFFSNLNVIYKVDLNNKLKIIISQLYDNRKNKIIFDSNKFILADNNYLFTSDSGLGWESIETPKIEGLNSAFYLSGKYLAFGTDKFIFSYDGENWKEGELPDKTVIQDASSNGRNFIAAGTNGEILYSDNASYWSTVIPFTEKTIAKIIWDGYKYCAFGQRGLYMSSSDGVNWIIQRSFTDKDIKDALWDGKRYVVTGASGLIMTSVNGNTWIKAKTNTYSDIGSIVYTGGMYIASGKEGTILTSENSKNWEEVQLSTFNDDKMIGGIAESIEDLTIAGDRIMAFGDLSSIFTGRITDGKVNLKDIAYSKTNKEYYTLVNPVKKGVLNHEIGSIAHNGDETVLTFSEMSYPSLSLLHTNDNKNFRKFYPQFGNIGSVFSNGKIFLAWWTTGDYDGCIITSKDGINWNQADTNFYKVLAGGYTREYFYQDSFSSIKYNGQEYLIRYGSTSYVSKDCLTWTKRKSNSLDNIKDQITLGTSKIKLTDDGVLWRQNDNKKWCKKNIDNSHIFSITQNGKVCIAAGRKGVIETIDIEGKVKVVKSPTKKDIHKVLWIGDRFAAVDSDGRYFVSADGSKWETKDFELTK